jgi:hypothetical protein
VSLRCVASFAVKEGDKLLQEVHAQDFFTRTLNNMKSEVVQVFSKNTKSAKPKTSATRSRWSFGVQDMFYKFSNLSEDSEFAEYQFPFPRVAALY